MSLTLLQKLDIALGNFLGKLPQLADTLFSGLVYGTLTVLVSALGVIWRWATALAIAAILIKLGVVLLR
jgi:hypothetical protein